MNPCSQALQLKNDRNCIFMLRLLWNGCVVTGEIIGYAYMQKVLPIKDSTFCKNKGGELLFPGMELAADRDEADPCCDCQSSYQQLLTVIAHQFHIILDDITHCIVQRASGNERNNGRDQKERRRAFAPACKNF